MKKKAFICVILFGLLFLSIFYIAGNEKNMIIEYDKSNRYSQKEIKQAINCVISELNSWKGCHLKKIWYDEEKSFNEENEWKENDSEMANKQIIILYTNFQTGFFARNDGFEPFTEFDEYEWILTKDDEEDKWNIYSSGYN